MLGKETTCTSPPKVENAVVLTAFQSGYADKSTVDYECRKSYKLTGNKTIECTRGTWSKSPTCKRKSEGKFIKHTAVNAVAYYF